MLNSTQNNVHAFPLSFSQALGQQNRVGHEKKFASNLTLTKAGNTTMHTQQSCSGGGRLPTHRPGSSRASLAHWALGAEEHENGIDEGRCQQLPPCLWQSFWTYLNFPDEEINILSLIYAYCPEVTGILPLKNPRFLYSDFQKSEFLS